MIYKDIAGVPDFEAFEYAGKSKAYVLLIPVINEGERIRKELYRAKKNNIRDYVDIVICDGGSTDGSLCSKLLQQMDINTLLVKCGSGKQGAQLRMGIWWALERGYEGVLTIDGNNKDSIEDVPKFIKKINEGYAYVQGSRFIDGGKAIRTPLSRLLAVKLIHAPVISFTARHRFTDTTNAFRGYAAEYLRDDRVQPLRDVFVSYELLAYLSTRATQLGYKACEVPVTRRYPKGRTPTKISAVRGNRELLTVLFKNVIGAYNPK